MENIDIEKMLFEIEQASRHSRDDVDDLSYFLREQANFYDEVESEFETHIPLDDVILSSYVSKQDEQLLIEEICKYDIVNLRSCYVNGMVPKIFKPLFRDCMTSVAKKNDSTRNYDVLNSDVLDLYWLFVLSPSEQDVLYAKENLLQVVLADAIINDCVPNLKNYAKMNREFELVNKIRETQLTR